MTKTDLALSLASDKESAMRVAKWTEKPRTDILAARRPKDSPSGCARVSGLRAVLLAAMLLAVAMLSACGGGSTNAPPPPPVNSVSVSPTSTLVDQGATIQFSARVLGSSNQAVVWSIQEGTSSGSIN